MRKFIPTTVLYTQWTAHVLKAFSSFTSISRWSYKSRQRNVQMLLVWNFDRLDDLSHVHTTVSKPTHVFQVKSELSSSLSTFLLHLFQKRTFGHQWHRFLMVWMPTNNVILDYCKKPVHPLLNVDAPYCAIQSISKFSTQYTLNTNTKTSITDIPTTLTCCLWSMQWWLWLLSLCT